MPREVLGNMSADPLGRLASSACPLASKVKVFQFCYRPLARLFQPLSFFIPFPLVPFVFPFSAAAGTYTDEFLAPGLELKIKPVEAREILDQSR